MAPDLSGTVFDGRYRLISLLGMGGMGQVYEGTHISLERRVAIKILSSDLSEDPRFRVRFAREARAAARINHRNVVQIMDFGGSPDGPVYFVMEFLDGRDLGVLLREVGRLPWPRARRLLLQAVSALKSAHAHGIIHRDIKPGNCFLVDLPHEDLIDVVKLLDFGIAKVLSEVESQGGTLVKPLTATGEIMGTASYMAPEQTRGEHMDARSDVYSLGIMAYEVLTGRVPFAGINIAHVVTRVLFDRPEPLHRTVPDILPDVENIVLRAIEKNPRDRFQSMAELEEAILAVQDVTSDSAQTRVFSTTGPSSRGEDEQRGSSNEKPNDPTVVLHEVEVEQRPSEDSFEDAETPSPLLLRHRFGEPFPLGEQPKEEPSGSASAVNGPEEAGPKEAELEETELEKTEPEETEPEEPAEAQPTRVRVATPLPHGASIPVLVAAPAEVATGGESIVVDVVMAVEPAERAQEPTEEPVDALSSGSSEIVVDEEPMAQPQLRAVVGSDLSTSIGTSSRRERRARWPRLLGLVIVLGSGGAVAAFSLSEARETHGPTVAAGPQAQAPSDSVPTSVATVVPETKRSSVEARPISREPKAAKAPAPAAAKTVVGPGAHEPVSTTTVSPNSDPKTQSMPNTMAETKSGMAGAGVESISPDVSLAKKTPRAAKVSLAQTDDCQYDRAQAQKAHDVEDFAEVLKLAAPGPCWPTSLKLKRVRLHQDALSNTKQYAKCVAEGAGIHDVAIRTATEHCQRKLDDSSPK